MSDYGFEAIARERAQGMIMRLGLAALGAVIATLLHPTWWPMAWLALYAAAQGLDLALFRLPEQRWQALLIASLALNATIFSSLAVYNWCFGGVEGKIFAAIAICCSLISATVSLYHKKRYLYAVIIPHALYLISLPVIGLATHLGRPAPWAMVAISIVTYLVYLMAAAQRLNTTLVALEKARDEACAANTAKSNFLAVISHEIRTPMNAVVSGVHLLRGSRLDPAQTAHLNMLDNASAILLGLLNDVLDLSRIEAGKLRCERTDINLRATLDQLESMFRPQLAEKGLHLSLWFEPGIAYLIMGDPLRLQQILFNLLSNAIKFSGGEDIELRVLRHDGNLLFEVKDHGIGIAVENLERIFNPFEQAEAAMTRRFGGTGLGLTISRQLARLMHGDISVVSTPGKGSCFTLRLPYEPAATPEQSPSGHAAKSLHVLIVDDHEINRRIVSLFIEPHGWTYTFAATGAEALEQCGIQHFDVILMDMQMPVMDGITATRQLRAEAGINQHTPVVALTANVLEHHVAAWAEAGVHDVLGKPIDPALLIATLYEKAEQVMAPRSSAAA